jgi:hypothetical protein
MVYLMSHSSSWRSQEPRASRVRVGVRSQHDYFPFLDITSLTNPFLTLWDDGVILEHRVMVHRSIRPSSDQEHRRLIHQLLRLDWITAEQKVESLFPSLMSMSIDNTTSDRSYKLDWTTHSLTGKPNPPTSKHRQIKLRHRRNSNIINNPKPPRARRLIINRLRKLRQEL